MRFCRFFICVVSRPGTSRRPCRRCWGGEPDPLAIAGSPAIPNLHPGNLDSTDPCLDRAFGSMTLLDNGLEHQRA
jgi:hypothetical protein